MEEKEKREIIDHTHEKIADIFRGLNLNADDTFEISMISLTWFLVANIHSNVKSEFTSRAVMKAMTQLMDAHAQILLGEENERNNN